MTKDNFKVDDLKLEGGFTYKPTPSILKKQQKPISEEDWFKALNWEGSLIIFAFLGCQEPIINSVEELGLKGYSLSLFIFALYALFLISLSKYLDSKHPQASNAVGVVSEMLRTTKMSGWRIMVKMFTTSWMFTLAFISLFIIMVSYLI